MRYKIFAIFIFVVIIIICFCNAAKQKGLQQRVRIQYYNPDYVVNVTVLTRRKSRRSAYYTSFNSTILWPWTNNVTVSIQVQNTKLKSENYELKFKVCDGFKLKWLRDALREMTDVNPVCPLPARTYHMIDIEWPPRNMPLVFSSGNTYYVQFTAMSTKDNNLKIGVIEGYYST